MSSNCNVTEGINIALFTYFSDIDKGEDSIEKGTADILYLTLSHTQTHTQVYKERGNSRPKTFSLEIRYKGSLCNKFITNSSITAEGLW